LSLTIHYLQPGLSGQDCEVQTRVLRGGRQLSTARATLMQQASARLEVLAAMGRLRDASDRIDSTDAPQATAALDPVLTMPAPDIPPPEQCLPRSPGAQGVPMAIVEQLDIRLHPDQVEPGRSTQARVSGWIRFADGRAPDPLACLLFADAFPPPMFTLFGAVGWVPTVELTIQLRRRPAPGWMLGAFETRDLVDGRLVEDGALWDCEGHLVARSRQLALFRRPPAAG
jgi:acyl-CoA thioesterase